MIGPGRKQIYRPSFRRHGSGAALEFCFADDASLASREGNVQLVSARAGNTSAMRTNSAGVLELVPHDVPRLDFDPNVLQFENLWTWSSDLSTRTGVWNGGGAVRTPDAAIAPNGKLGATLFDDTGASAAPGVPARAFTVTDATMTVSIYTKAKTALTRRFLLWNGTLGASVGPYFVFDFTNPDTVPPAGWSVESCGDGWYRIIASLTGLTVGHVLSFYYGRPDAAAAGATDQWYLWGGQVNSGPTALKYRATGANAHPKQYACKGLLIEDGRTNHLIKSCEIDSVSWEKRGACTVMPNWFTAPDGTAAMDYVQNLGPLSTDGLVSASAGNLGALGGRIEPSFYVRKVAPAAGTLEVRSPSGSSYGQWLIDFSLLTAGKSERITRSHPAVTVVIEFVAPGTSGTGLFFGSSNGPLSFGLWGCQLEVGSFSTSFIPTTTASAARGQDIVDITWTGWFNEAEGTMLADVSALAWDASDGACFMQIDNGSNTGNRYLLYAASSTSLRFYSEAGGTSSAPASHAATLMNRNKLVGAYGSGTVQSSMNGSAVNSVAATPTAPTPNRARLYVSTSTPNGHIRRIAYWRHKASNADLQRMSA